MKIRKKIFFYGQVQGVGFRYHASHGARGLDLTGFVRNEYDGSVYMEIQGEEALIDQLLVSLNKNLYIDIEHMEIKNMDLREDESGFSVKY